MSLARIAGLLPPSVAHRIARLSWRHPLLRRGFEWMADRFRNRDGVISQGVGKGLKFNAGQSNAGYLLGTTESGLQKVLPALVRPGMTVYDIGANVGFHTCLFARLVGPSGKVVGFEPVPELYAQAEHNLTLNRFENATLRREAIGLKDGRARFRVYDIAQIGRLDSSEWGIGKPDEGQSRELDVEVRSLDSLAPDLPAPDLIKIDVEGSECDVLGGASALIARTRPILIVELHDTNRQVGAILDDLGYHRAILGHTGAIETAHWNSCVVAYPAERPELEPVAVQVTESGEWR